MASSYFSLLVFMLATSGMTIIVTYSKIFASVREYFIRHWPRTLGALIHCALCFGFWAGIFWWGIGLFPRLPIGIAAEILASGCTGSVTAWTAFLIFHRLGASEM